MGIIPENTARLEALLFYHGEPIQIKKISALLSLKDSETADLVDDLSLKLDRNKERGLLLLKKGDEAQLVTKPVYGDILQKIIQDELREELTPVALETLSIIAYLGPLGRAQLDYVRGVNSSFILRNLILRGLVQRKESKRRGGAYDYEVSFDFLKHIGLSGAEELPEYQKYREILNRMRMAEAVKKE